MHRIGTLQALGAAALAAALVGSAGGCSGDLARATGADGGLARGGDDIIGADGYIFDGYIGPICAEETLQVGLHKLDMFAADLFPTWPEWPTPVRMTRP